MALVETVRAAGLDRALSQVLSRWRKPLARHDPGKIVTDLALALAVGGDCLADIAVLRAEPAVFGSVASDPTVSRLVDTLAADCDKALRAIGAARAAARARVWAAAGEHGPDHGASVDNPVVIDVDATLITAHSDKELAAPCPQGRVGVSRRLGLGLVALRRSGLPGHPAGEPLTHTHHRDEVVNGCPPACRA